MKIVTSITLLAMLFVLVLAGTLSGAFGVEENLVQNGIIQSNVASAVTQNTSTHTTTVYWTDARDSSEFSITRQAQYWNVTNTPTNTNARTGTSTIGFSTTGYKNQSLQIGRAYHYIEVGDFSATSVTIKFKLKFRFNREGGHISAPTITKGASLQYSTDGVTYDWISTGDGGLDRGPSNSGDDGYGQYKYYTGWSLSGDDTIETTEMSKTINGSFVPGQKIFLQYVDSWYSSSNDRGWKSGTYGELSFLQVSFGGVTTTINLEAGDNGSIAPSGTQTFNSSTASVTSVATGNKGYHFDKWDDGDTSKTRTFTGTNITPLKTYVANFAINTLTARYYNNTNPSDDTYDDQTITYNSSGKYSLKTLPKSEDGRTFVGWAIKADGDVYYKYGEKAKNNLIYQTDISLASNHGAIVKFYAVWIDSDFGVLAGGDKNNGTWGSASNPFVIENSQHLKNLSDIVNGVRYPVDSVSGTYYGKTVTTVANEIMYTNCYFVVTADIDMSGISNFAIIGTQSKRFGAKQFDFQGFDILNLTLSGSGEVGLFGYLKGIAILSTGSSASNPTVFSGARTSTGDYVGALAGFIAADDNNKLSGHFKNECTVVGTKYVGGLIGQISGTATNYIVVDGLENIAKIAGSSDYVGGIFGAAQFMKLENYVKNSGTISGANNVGGLIGHSIGYGGSDNVWLYNGENSGNITSTGSNNNIGGLIGHAQDTYYYGTNKNTGTVTASSSTNVGGVVGYFHGGAMKSGAILLNSNTVHGANNVGGIAGQGDWGSIWGAENAITTNSGAITGSVFVGGIVGLVDSLFSVVWTKNQNQVVGKNYVGGIVGGLKYLNEYNNSIEHSTNTGTIGNTSSSSNVGGILGGCVDNQIDFKIENCSNNGNIDAKNANYVGGIAGSLKGKVTITNCENAYSISGKENVGGLVGNIEGGAAITTSGNSGAVNGYKHLGGFVGYAKSSGSVLSIEGTSTAPLVNGGNVTSTIPSGSSSANNDGGVAGFVGYLDGDSNITISHCVNNGVISGKQFNGIAGILGYVKHGSNLIYINNCKNTALVEGGINTGGIGGRLSTNSSAVNSMVISHCYNGGEILTQDYSTGSTGNSGTTGGICGYFNTTSTTAAERTAVISYCYNVGNVKIIKSTSGQAFAQNDSNKGFIGGIVGNAKSDASNPDTNGKVAIEYCYVDLTSGHSIVRYGTDMTTYINGTNLATVNATSYVIKKGTSITAGNGGSYLLYNATTTFDYPLVDGTQTTWENILTQNINGFRLTTNVADGYYYASLKGVGGELLTPDNLEVAGTSPYTVNAKYYVDNANGNIFVGTTEIVVNHKTETYKAAPLTIDNPSLPSGYDFKINYFDTADYSGTSTESKTNAGTYYTETLVKIGDKVVGRLKDSTKGILTINKKALSMTWTPSALASPYTYNAQHQGITNVTISGFEGTESLAQQLANTVFELNVTNLDGKTLCTITKNANENLFEIANAINVGLYGIKVELVNATNYTLTTETREWEIIQRELTFGNSWTDGNCKNQIDRTSADKFIYNGKLQGLAYNGIEIGNRINTVPVIKNENGTLQNGNGIFDVTYTLPHQSGYGFAYKAAGTYFRKYTLVDKHNYTIAGHADGIVEYKWTIAKNQITVRNAWTSDPVNNNTDYYNFTFNGAAQGIGSFMLFAQEYTNSDQSERIRPEIKEGTHYSVVYSSEGSVNVGTYTATLSILGDHADNFEFVDGMTESYVATIPAIDSTDNIIDRKGVSVTTNAITYSWKINQFDVSGAFASGKAWFGAGTDMVVANQNTVKTENVNGTEFAYYYLQANEGDTPKVIVYQNANYKENNFVLYVQYTTKTNNVEAHRLVKLAYGTDYTIANLGTAGEKHVKDVSVTASGTNNFVGDAVKYYVVADSDFGGNVNQAGWGGDESNPYVIEHESQLLRLSQIVNGGVAWNSINGADGLVANTRAQATNRTYEGCYFVVKADITLLQSSVSGITGFEPIGNLTYQFKAAQFAKGKGIEKVSIEYSFSDTAREYVGLFGYIYGTSIVGIDVVGVGTIKGNQYVGGIVGYANGGKIKNCSFSLKSLSQDEISGSDYVGGIVGYANGTAIVSNSDRFMQSKVNGASYVGGIAGEWIVTDAEQINDKSCILTYAANIMIVGSGSYVGGIAGRLDASKCANDLLYSAIFTNGIAGIGSDNVMDVFGTSYVGALFGAFVGNGYHDTADGAKAKSIILVNKADDVRANVIANGGGRVIGGLVGYAEKVGILFGDNYVNESMVMVTGGATIAKTGVYVDAKGNTSFVGGIVGVLGENATIESVRQTLQGVTVSEGTYSVTNKTQLNGKDFVGGIAGYIANTAGTYFGTTGTVFGNSIQLFNEGAVNGYNFVGGLVGGIGIVENYASYIGSDDNLKKLLSATHNTNAAILGYSTLERDPYTQNPFGKAVNVANVIGNGNYVGGLFGYVGDRVSLTLENDPITSVLTDDVLDSPSQYLNVYNGNKGKTTDASITIKGASYVGGITGWLDHQSHDLNYVVSRARVQGTNYVGGFVGYMSAGSIFSSLALAPEDANAKTDAYIGTDYIGGFVGYVVGGTIKNSISTGFKFESTGISKSGIMGNGINPTIEGSWTIYVKQNALYSDVSLNSTKGRYLLIDAGVEDVPSIMQLSRMVGLYVANMTYNGNTYTVGKLLVNAKVPSATANKQLAFYDLSGSDRITDNMSVDQDGNVTGTNFTRFGNFNDIDGNLLTIEWAFDNASSFSICLVDVRFVNVANHKDKEYKQNTPEGKLNAQNAYKEPSASKLYVAEVTHAEYWWYKDGDPQKGLNNEGQIKKLTAVIYFKYQNTLIKVGEIGNYRIGGYDKEYDNNTIGTQGNPIIISSQEEWNEFAHSIYTGKKNYKEQFVRLTTDIKVDNTKHLGTNGGELDFGKKANASVATNATTNVGYNFAGSIAIGAGSTIDDANKSFQGTFDGNGHTIEIDYTSGGYNRVSVFPNAGANSTTDKQTVFKNLTIKGTINGGTSKDDAGYDMAGFVGKPFGAIKFENCTNAANIQGLRIIAGIAGCSTNSAPIRLIGCVNKGNITSYEGSEWTKNTGQNIGYPKDYSYGTGGIIAYASADIAIESCLNTGTIIGQTKVGGIVGRITGSSKTTASIKNCANTGYIEAQELNPYNVNDQKNRAGNAWSRVGGLVGEADQNTALTILASYNTGAIRGWSNIAGGLVGILGTIPDDEKPHSTVASHSSTIAYSYNTGSVTIGYEQWSGIIMIGSSGYNFNGTNAGGIVGVAVQANINYCYNTGAITAYGGVGYGGSWQSRNGGIVSEVVTETGGKNCKVEISNCYNVGAIELQESKDSTARYNADIVGYMEKAQDANSSKIKVTNCYGVANNIIVWRKNAKKYFSGWSDNHGVLDGVIGPDIKCVRTGTTLRSLADLTAVINSDGTVKPVSYDTNNNSVNLWNASTATLTNESAFNNATASGYVYLTGCLPQLAVFALDTHNGLSMRSVGYGLNIYNEYEQQAAGSKVSPYVIKDGIDLFGMQALVDLGYTFDGKYIEFANANNNITLDTNLSSVVSRAINMSTHDIGTNKIDNGGDSFKSSKDGVTFDQEGKSYYLFKLGGVCRDDLNSTANSAYTTWLSRNYYYEQNTQTMANNATFAAVNFLPIGRYGGYNVFKGSISGKQADETNTEVANLRIVSTGTDHAFAGLFARAESAEISYITVSGAMRAYATNPDGHSAVGGIVADSSGDTIIDHCNAGSASRQLSLFAYGAKSAYEYANVKDLHTYAGGIVGVATTSFYQYGTHNYYAGTASVIRNCEVVNATVKSVKNNIGGIVGYVDGQSKANGKNNKIELTGNVVSGANLYALPASGTDIGDIGTKVGGILGYSDQYISVIISGCTVGTDSATKSVTIRGENSIGGIVGALPNAINEIKNCSVKASTLIERGNEWGIVENVNNSISGDSGNHGTAIGGIIGYTYHNTSENAVTTTLSGNISFAGTIKIDYATQDDAVRNVGGVFGDMASGASFATGAVINVSGAIEVANSIKTDAQNAENSGVRNIGGVAGRTRDVAFSGNFTVSLTINIPNAYYVGGFIGRNRGEVNILADNTTISIGAKLSGAHDVGGFIGDNDASTGAILYIGANEYRRTRYEKPLSIVISQEATISASGDNVGGIVGGNTSNGGSTVGAIRIVKGSITNNGQVVGANSVGGIIGNNNANLTTGGGTGPDNVKGLTIVNNGAVNGKNYVGGVFGKINQGSVAGTFTNIGDVTGEYFVGGSIGYVSYAATITALGNEDTKFENGAIAGYTASGDALTAGDTAAQGVGTVKGKAYVGGSIGIMLGKIVGNANAKVVFTSSGIVDASDVAGYLGGSIGVIAGQVDYAQFISTGELTGINAITAVGGSVGFIGAPTPLLKVKDGNTNCTEEYAIDLGGALFNRVHIKNSHFESNGASLVLTGTRVNEAKYNGDVQRQDYEWGGVGGAIGVIAGVANGFDGGVNWANNTYYAQGSVTAPGVYNVGGIVGFIRANNITINNMLAYDIDVTGGSNVGGIIGFTEGEKTVIANAFAISTSDSTGKYTAEYTTPNGTKVAGLAGGIIGKAADDTDASTSYWVKGYKNADLAGTNVNDLKNTLGRYTAITETIGQTTIIFTKELIGGTDVAEPVYPTPYEYLSAYYGENEQHTVNGKTLTIADTFEYDETTQVTTYKTWEWYFTEYYKNVSTDSTVVKTQDGTWVYAKNTWAQYSTGTSQTGWYFVYANDAAGDEGNVGTVNAKHTYKRSTQGEYTIVDRDFWKRIANAYTASEKEKGLNDPSNANYKLNSDIVLSADDYGNKAPLVNNLYATATAATKSGYYLYIASSGDSRPTAKSDGGKFYIQINTVDVDNAKESAKLAKNVAVYYRSIAMGSALTYNGYNRYAPISLQKDIKSEPGITDGKKVSDPKDKNSYAYTTELVEPQTVAKTVGTYKSNVFVYYYDDTGTAYKVGGITHGAWKIKQRTLTFNATSVNNKVYGDKDIESKVTIQNVAPNDRDAITFVLSIKGVDTPITINDLKAGKSYLAKDYQGIEITLVTASQDGALSGADANFIAETITDKSTYKIEFNIKFTNAKKYEISTSLADGLSKTNYVMSNSNQNVEVKKRGIDVKIDSNNKSAFFDGKYTHGTTWTFSNIADEAFGDTWQSVLKAFSPLFVAEIEKEGGAHNIYTSDLVGKNSLTYNKVTLQYDGLSTGRITFTGAGDVGNYYLRFSDYGQNDVNNTSNYYIKLTDGESESYAVSKNMLNITWSRTNNGTHVYDKSTIGTITASVVADHGIENLKSFVETYFTREWGRTKGETDIIVTSSNNTTATITFKTLVNAGTYTAKLTVNKQTHQDKINCSYTFKNGTTFSYVIEKRTLLVSFDYAGEKGNKATGYIYTTRHQGLNGIKVDNLITGQNGDTVKIHIAVVGENVVYPYKAPPQDVSYSGTGVKTVSNINTIDVGTYYVTATLSSNANYQLSSTPDSWEIKKYSISLSGLTSSSKIYDGIPFKPTVYINNNATTNGEAPYEDDLITVNYKATSDKFGNGFVNKGEYTVSIGKGDITAKRKNTGSDTTLNYDVTANQSAQFTITARPITVKWNPTQTFIYNGQLQGITLASAEGGGQVKLTSCDVSSAQITGYAGGDVIHLTLGGGKVHVNDTPSVMTAAITGVTGTNSDGSNSDAKNYELIVDTEKNNGTFNIVAASLYLEYVSGVVSKEYDATVSANVSDLTFRVISNTSATLPQSSFKITGVYLDKHVGNDKTVKVTVKCNDTSGDFAYVGADTFEIANVGSITPKELEVKLDKLRSGKATRVYNGTATYGGAGATYSSGTSARSAVYRSGEGFVVDGFPTAEQSGTVTISAVYKEADAKRGEFDSYVNFVYVDENKVYHKGTVTNKLFKTLVFSISGECAQNYTFKVTNGTDAYSGTVGNKDQSVTVYDSRDEQNKDKRPANAGNINIEITVKSFKVEYTNTSQSYANSDNTYNTDWKAVEAIKTPDGTTVTVLNGWMTDESGNPKTYNKYTVIRGRMGSKQLSAQVSGEKGMEHNYNMSNQPILTIGYFVDKTDFEVGSIASLMIASYYWYASQHADSPDFTPIVSAGSEWVSIVTNDVYGTGAFGESNKPADAPKDCNSWDEYFAYIEKRENVTVFLNEYEKNSWGYYKTTQTTTKPAYTSYRQTADFTGIVKQADIEILNNFFTTYTFGEDGTATPTQHTWGKGGEYITNFLKPSVGNVLTALGSVFVSTDAGFGGTYNGNGYVIEYLNIYGFGGAKQNVGMFDKIGNGSVSGLHLRNVTISANGGNVGGIAGEILAGGETSSDVTNVSFHGSITVSGSGNVGGLFGKSARNIDKAIVLGTITANGGNVAGVVGVVDGLSCTLSNVVSLMQVDASGTVAPIATGGTVNNDSVFYLANAVWSKDSNGKIAYAGGNGTAKSYAELMGGSTSGYGKDNKYYYAGETPNTKGVYDVVDDVLLTKLDVDNKSNPRQSMRLRDIVDVYLLMYSLSETTASGGDINGARTYTISTTSWLVGERHGTSKDDAIVIANKQNVALLRQLRFATFVLMVDLASYEAQSFGGAFYGTIYQNGHSIPTDWLSNSFADVTNAKIENE